MATGAVKLSALLDPATLLSLVCDGKPLAIVLAGHNGSGKSTWWYDKLADGLKLPLINADRLTLSILPEPQGDPPELRPWAARLRDSDQRWQRLSQNAVQALLEQVVSLKISFAYETVFSHWRQRPDGSFESKIQLIDRLQSAGYSVALFFVGLASAELSIARVATRRAKGGHDVPLDKLLARFPRTQLAIRHAASRADLTIMVDNSRVPGKAYSLARMQVHEQILYDCRDQSADADLVKIASQWLSVVAPSSSNS